MFNITEEDKQKVAEIKRILGIEDDYQLGYQTDYLGILRNKGQNDLADFANFDLPKRGELYDVLIEIEIDKKFSKELKEIEEGLKNL